MKTRYDLFSAVVITILLAIWCLPSPTRLWRTAATKSAPLLIEALDAETVFSLGLRLPLTCTDLSSLELIPNLSNRVAERVVAQRMKIARDAGVIGLHEALKKVFGIGDATSKKLLDYINPSAVCAESEALRETFSPSQ